MQGVEVGDGLVRVRLPDAQLDLHRERAMIDVRSDRPVTAAELVHPYLSPACAVFARWAGREALHAGAFLGAGGEAWGVVGDSGDGKSTLLGALALAGRTVLADDLLVVAGGRCFAGPRCLDLRPESAERLGVQEGEFVRASSRLRMRLGDAPAEAPLGGFLFLEWGEPAGLRRVPYAERVTRLAAHRRAMLGLDPVGWLDLAALPAHALRRPRDWSALADAVARATTLADG